MAGAGVGAGGCSPRSVIHSCEEKRQLSAKQTDALDRLVEVTAKLVGGGWVDRRGVLLLALLIVPGVEAQE